MSEALDKMMEDGMQIIMFAGEARVSCQSALSSITDGDSLKAEEEIKKADEQIAKAHHIQTDAIQGTIEGENQEYSLLFAHAQDTLMTVYSEIHMTKQLLKTFTVVNKRLEALEKTLN